MSVQTKSGHPVHPIGIGTWGYGEYPTFSPGTEAQQAAYAQKLLWESFITITTYSAC